MSTYILLYSLACVCTVDTNTKLLNNPCCYCCLVQHKSYIVHNTKVIIIIEKSNHLNDVDM